MPTLKIHGRKDPDAAPPELARGLPKEAVRPKHSAVLSLARADQAPVPLDNVADDDIVELEMQDGIRLWVRVDKLQEDFGLTPSRDQADGAIEVPTTLRLGGGPSRGLGEWAIKGLKVFGIDIPGQIGTFVSNHVESQLKPAPGLFRCSLDDPGTLLPVEKITSTGATLLLLHGTASSTPGAFSALWEGGADAPIRRLFEAYDGRVLAFQHPTLTLSPIQNTVALVKELSKILSSESPLHLVSHSRGGLIGELLARGMRIGAAAFDEADLVLFDESRQKDRQGLIDLAGRFEAWRPRIERFVRVACPARGTTLADGRLDRYFSILTNVVGQIPFLKASPIYDGLTALVAAVLKLRTDPDQLPGLEAMMPGSALVRMLNRPNVQSRADLHVLGGDLAGAGVWGRLKTLATDLYYLQDHDLVVNTRAMFGGVERSTPVRYWVDTGGEVTHFHYFSRRDTAGRLLSALGKEGETDYHTFEHKTSDELQKGDYVKRAPGPQPVVFVLPGIMGSNLRVDQGLVWMSYLLLGAGGMGWIAKSVAKVKPDSLMESGYGKLVRHLSLTHEVVPFPYDWRRSVADNGELLRQQLLEKIKTAADNGQPVRILAHSMGGLVVRAMLATPEGQEAWTQMCRQPGARFVMLGTPNGGSHAIAALLMGRDALAKKLALIDVRHSYAELMAIICGFDGVLNLLPHENRNGQQDLDLLTPDSWQLLYKQDVPSARGLFSSSAASSKSAGISWAVPDAGQLAAARKVRSLIQGSPIDPNRMIYVAGLAPETPCRVEIDEQADPGRRVRVLATALGDGRVPWATGIPKGLEARTYYMRAIHGDMASSEADFPAIVDLLTLGTTSKLAQSAPAGRGGVNELFPMRETIPTMLPDMDDLVASALGSSGKPMVTASVRKATVRVVHGNLSRATSPVLVGHYKDDMIVNAEAYLDSQLLGRLRELHRMRLYPDRVGTAAVVLNEPGSTAHPGAIVVGLGRVGNLTPGTLMSTLTQGLTQYGAERVAWTRRQRQRRDVAAPLGTIDTPVTIVLVGSGEGGLTLSDSLLAILRAVRQANDRLALAREPEGNGSEARGGRESLAAFINSVDVLELYEDRAIQAVRTLRQLAAAPEVRDALLIEERLITGQEGQRRITYEEPAEWWQRIRITGDQGSLKFEAVTQRARADSNLSSKTLTAARSLLDGVAATTARDVSVGKTLFELLVPPGFKEHAPEQRRLALMLDPEAASIPWELLHDGYDRAARPLAVDAGLIRQLLIPEDGQERRDAAGSAALVIGNPVVRDPRFPTLQGAEREAAAVAQRLRQGGFETIELLGASADPHAVLTRLYERPWRVMHLAAHGVFEFRPTPEAEPVTGMVLDDFYLTPELLTQMRTVPELVFINCCHLGATKGDVKGVATAYHRLAANVATEFIKMGARAVVAAGWAVDDEAARDFALKLYDELLSGNPYGEAIRLAREAVFERYGATNTWGAYQCYGDAQFVLRAKPSISYVAPLVSVSELTLAAEGVATEALAAGPRDVTRLLQKLETLVTNSPADWLDDSCACAAVARAYAELGAFDKAIQQYNRFATMERAEGPIRALEQLANLRARWAEQVSAGNGDVKVAPLPEGETPESFFQKAEALLQNLLAVGETAERYALVGSLYKRRAMAFSDAERRRAALTAMAEAYGKAYERAHKDPQGRSWYPLPNWLAARIVLGWREDNGAPAAGRGKRRPKGDDSIAEGLAELQRLTDGLAADGSTFWAAVLDGDRQLLAALVKRVLDADTSSVILNAYQEAARRGGSARQMSSVLDQVRFLTSMAQSELKAEDGKALVTSLQALAAALARV